VQFSTATIECMKSHMAEHVESIVEALMKVCSVKHSVVSMSGVLQILCFLMSGRQHRALVPAIVTFLLQTILPLLSQSEDLCAELADGYFKALEAAMSNHLKVLWTDNQGASARAILRVLCEGLNKAATSKPCLEVLELLSSNHRLGPRMRQDPNWTSLLDEIISVLLKALLIQRNMLDFDLAVNVLHSLIAVDMKALDRILLECLESETKLLPAQRAALAQMNSVSDGRTFSLRMQRICNDYEYFVGLCSQQC